MARAEFRAILLGVAASGLLTACVDSTGGDGAAGATDGLFAAPATRTSNREVEAPEIFQATDSALWDGRPSLGGIWVASPDVVNPERVVMFNPANGKSVNGALFKRERDNPGPRLQISSDAAEALGILAGQPTEIRVTALRKQEVAVPAEAEGDPAMEGAAPKGAPPEGAVAEAADASETAALAAAALDAADAGTQTSDTTADTSGEGAEAAAAEATAAEPPAKKTWKERRAEAKAKREAEKAAKAAAAAAAGEAPVDGSDTVDPADSAVAAIETAPLDARTPEAAASPSEPAVAEPPAAEPTLAATGTRTIQIASFSKEENAKRAVDALSKIGISAEPKKSDVGGKPVWGVVTRGDAALLQKIKDAGFADAYFLT